MSFKPNCSATGIGSLPHTNPKEACELILKTTCRIPFWPQMPRLGFCENMYVQFAHNLPNAMINLEEQKIFIDTLKDNSKEVEKFYQNILDKNLESFAYDEQYFRGFYAFLEFFDEKMKNLSAVKGQITGPISLGLHLTDEKLKPIFYNETYKDIILKNLKMHVAWQERKLKEICAHTILSVDEPYLSAFGSAYFSISKADVIGALEGVFEGIKGTKAIHCCGNTDWSILMDTSADIIFFDAYNYFENFILYRNKLEEFLSRDGIIGWGIVPHTEEALRSETSDHLLKKFENNIQKLVDKGLNREVILQQSLITPSCGLGGTLAVESSIVALTILRELSNKIRAKFALSED